MTETAVTILSSMATKAALAELAAASPHAATSESAGGVHVARRVREGEAIDLVVLASDVMQALASEGHVLAETLTDFAISAMVVAVREGTPRPDLASAEAVRAAVLAAPRIGYSTGPSGQHLLRLLDQWGIREQLGTRLVQAPPGTPVGKLLQEGQVDLAMQQQSEFMNLAGVAVVGPLPPPIQANTVFTVGIARAAPHREAARRVLAFLASPESAEAKRRHGLRAP